MVRHLSAEVEGVDWSRPISDGLVSELVKLQDKYAVLIFRNTGLDNTRHIAFAQRLDKDPEINPFFFGRENDRISEPFLWDLENINRDGSIVSPGQRPKYSLLLSHGNLVKGGSWTHFSDTRGAYAALSQSRKEELEDIVVEHDLWHSRKLAAPEAFEEPLPHERELVPPVSHKLVQVTPDGRKTLYMAAHAKRIIIGKSFEESQKLIWELIDHCTQPQLRGDMVWWDNRQPMHRANPYTTSMTARDVRRATVNDDGPFAMGVSEEIR
ncbi:Clavaminate synthase-like protein [Bimuria novae-zelandiae CBS 107.79]|uniref:Clavaminate synthase-like protein n=1 Tax=Bimuria novae-zelandiae CBS 107.79 TaxID=1447943 RepID=A0A6A5UTV2_9PLEO|nr:Clavaminate synthase-like protein [Bimuria novae-zelandiae CBS 107.79]